MLCADKLWRLGGHDPYSLIMIRRFGRDPGGSHSVAGCGKCQWLGSKSRGAALPAATRCFSFNFSQENPCFKNLVNALASLHIIEKKGGTAACKDNTLLWIGSSITTRLQEIRIFSFFIVYREACCWPSKSRGG